jgi:transcriptional regulator with XRE-family HTH domain
MKAVSKQPATFPARLAQLRERAGLSRYALSSLAGLHATAYRLLEAGQADPRLSTLQRLAAALGCTVGDLADGPP